MSDVIDFDRTKVVDADVFGAVKRNPGPAATARIALAAVIERFPKLRLADPDFYPEIVGGPKERGIRSMPLRID